MALLPMTRRGLLRRLDSRDIEAAIRRAESRSSGEIRVSVVGFFRGDSRRLGDAAFTRLGMAATRHRNGVLILLAPTRRTIVIVGDDGIHARVGDDFWRAVTRQLAGRFRGGEFTPGLIEAIERIGEGLAAHFPPGSGSEADANELPDSIDRGGS
jgi:uncharacterized membrane protein